jgi:hypothetical protein
VSRRNLLVLAGIAVVLLVAGFWLSAHRAERQSNLGGAMVFPDLRAALAEVSEVRLSKGDGSRVTLRRTPAGWLVVERNYPADGSRVRDLLLNLAAMKVVEVKTSDPANYPKLGVEAPSPTAASTLFEVVSAKKTWTLLVGKGAGGRTIYVRKPEDAASALVEPVVSADTEQKPWIDRMLAEIPGADIHQVEVSPAKGPAYTLTRDRRGGELVMSPVPKGRKPATANFAAHAESISSLFLDEVRAVPSPAPVVTDRTTYRTFDGQVIEITGHRDDAQAKAYIALNVRRDPELAAKFPPPAPAATPAVTPAVTPENAMADAAADAAKPAETAATPAAGGPEAAAAAPPAAPEKASAKTVERLATRVTGFEFEIPIYKYELLFKPHSEQLEPN